MALSIFLVIQVVLGLSLVALVLLQQGKGADMGAAFGSGASGTVFGSQGSGNFMTRSTAVVATLFMVNSLLLSTGWILGSREAGSVTEIPGSVMTQPATDLDVPEAPVEEAADLPAMGESLQAVPDEPPADLPE